MRGLSRSGGTDVGRRRKLRLLRTVSVLFAAALMVYLVREPRWMQGTTYLSLGGLAQQFGVSQVRLPFGTSVADLRNGVYTVAGWQGRQAVHLVSLRFKAFPTGAMTRVQTIPGWEHPNWVWFAILGLAAVTAFAQSRLVQLRRRSARGRRPYGRYPYS